MKIPAIVCSMIAAWVAAATATAVPGQAGSCRPGEFPSITFSKEAVFPKDGSLNRPEDGKALPDGRIIVADQKAGLRLVNPDGSSRPFGNLAKAGFENSAQVVAAPNGIHLEDDGRHLLVSDIYRGVMYRVDSKDETAEKIYEHTSGVNAAIRDSKGNIWFSQSADNPRPNGHETLYGAIDRAMPTGKLFFLPMKGDKAAGKAVEAASGLYFANGIGLSPDQKTLYAAETMANRVLSYKADIETGSLSGRTVAALMMTPDNLTVDSAGNIWVVSPVTNSVFVIESACGAVQRVFEAPSESNYSTSQKWAEAILEGKSIMPLFNPDAWQPLPGGFITGLFWSEDGGTIYITGLGNAILRYKIR